MNNQVGWRASVLQGLAVLLGILVAFGIEATWSTRMDQDMERQRPILNWFQTRAEPYFESEGDLAGMTPGWPGGQEIRFEMNPDAFVRNRRFANLLAARYLLISSSRSSALLLQERIDELIAVLEMQ